MNTPSSPKVDFKKLAKEEEAYFNRSKLSWVDYPLLVIFVLLFITVFLQFFTRYVLNDSIAWTEEAARYLLILLSFAGAIRCQTTGGHIALEFVDKYYGKNAHWVHIFALFVTAMLLAIIFYSAWELVQRTSFQNMVSLPFPKYYLYAGVMMLIIINFLVLIKQLFHTIAKKA